MNYLVMNHQTDPQQVEWTKLQKDKLNGVLVELGYGLERSRNARQAIAKAKKYNLTWHGYHTFANQTNEIEFAIANAVSLGLQSEQYLFLAVNTNTDDPVTNSYTFISTCQLHGFKPGLCSQASYYQTTFNDSDIVNAQVLRWLVSDNEPTNYDLWEYGATNNYGVDSLPIIFDKTNQLSSNISATTYNVTSNAYVGFGFDTTGLGGGISLGYSTNGYNFNSAVTPFGFIFREIDAVRMWKLLLPRITNNIFDAVKLRASNGNVYLLKVKDDGTLITKFYNQTVSSTSGSISISQPVLTSQSTSDSQATSAPQSTSQLASQSDNQSASDSVASSQGSAQSATQSASQSSSASQPASQPTTVSFIKGGNISPSGGMDPAETDKEASDMKLNSITASLLVRADNATSSDPVVLDDDWNNMTKDVDYLVAKGYKVIIQPYPWIASGSVVETAWEPSDFSSFMTAYKAIILRMAKYAESAGAWGIYIGTNLIKMENHESDWINLIKAVREVYHGKIIYRTNWWYDATWDATTTQNYQTTLGRSFWQYVDIIGVASYFELTDKLNPTSEDLQAALHKVPYYNRGQDIFSEVKAFADKWGKPILFGELGVPPFASGAKQPWDDVTGKDNLDYSVPANLFDAYYKVFGDQSWWLGYSIFTIDDSHSWYNPYGHPAADVIRKQFS